MTFGGAKLAILVRGRVLTLRRDDRPDILFPGHWDLPGGGREGAESPAECALRETEEELGLRYPETVLQWRREYPATPHQSQGTWFFVLLDDELDPGRVRLGDEGQAWQLMPVGEFVSHPRAVPHLAHRLASYLSERSQR